jgi:hypothetical protein
MPRQSGGGASVFDMPAGGNDAGGRFWMRLRQPRATPDRFLAARDEDRDKTFISVLAQEFADATFRTT